MFKQRGLRNKQNHFWFWCSTGMVCKIITRPAWQQTELKKDEEDSVSEVVEPNARSADHR